MSGNTWTLCMTSKQERKERTMDKPEFVYVTYIATTPDQLWKALVDAEMTKYYWQHVNISDWKPGSNWEHRRDDMNGEVQLVGKVLEAAPPAVSC